MLISTLSTTGLLASAAYCATKPAISQSKQEAGARGQIFIANRDEIVNKAKMEGKLRVITGLDRSVKITSKAFQKKYPFIALHEETIRGTDSAQRNLLEIKSGAAKDWDIVRTYTDFYAEYFPHLWKVDLLGMAEQQILGIPPKMIDPKNRNVIALLSRFQVTAYNKTLVSNHHVPRSWDDILAPEFRGRKFAADVRSQEIASLVPIWGLEKTIDFARKIAAQQPIWVRGGSNIVQSVGSGEIPLFLGANYSSVKAFQRKDVLGNVQFVILEPVPVRLSSEQAILATSKNPHAALLWLEWMASSEAQMLIDEHEPLASSIYVQGSAVGQELKGKKLSVVSWDQNEKMELWIAKIFEAYGFPKTGDAK
jgi:ABC-type Fe3+ transport system substrate-binding protein